VAVPRTRTAIRALLSARGLHPNRLRGQHFLVDGNLIDAIVRDARVGPGDCVLEVGTGTGILTDALADRAGAVLSVDIDAEVQEVARGLRAWPPSVHFLAADVLAGKHALDPTVLEAWRDLAGGTLVPRIVSNLPYAVATPFVANLLCQGLPCADATLLVQREAADRFFARPGTEAYGAVSVLVGLLARGMVLRAVPPQVFWPVPKVESALVRIEPLADGRAALLREAGLPALLRDGFSQRRKTLRKRFEPGRLVAAGIDPGARPGEVAPEAWERLCLGEKRPGSPP